RRRHTRSKRDWSSDVCSSDLPVVFLKKPPPKSLYTASSPLVLRFILLFNVLTGCATALVMNFNIEVNFLTPFFKPLHALPATLVTPPQTRDQKPVPDLNGMACIPISMAVS